MNINEIKELVENNAEVVKDNDVIVSKLNDTTTQCTKESPYTKILKCTGKIIISKGIDIDMCFDTIEINSIDGTGMHMSNENALERNYFHFYDNTNGNELQIPFDDIFNVIFLDEYKDKDIITTEFDDPNDFAVKLKHLEKWHHYSASVVVKSVNFEIFDINILLR